MRRSAIKCIVVAGLVFASNRVASANLFTNADFEGMTYVQGGTNDVLPMGWTNSQSSNNSKLNVYASGTGPGLSESGSYYMAFQASPTDTSQDCLNQDVGGTQANKQYILSFWVAMTANSQSQFGMTVEWDSGGSQDTTLGSGLFFDHPTSSSAVPYTFESFTETASSSTTSIYFHGADATGAIMLDNVSLTLAPEPRWLAAPMLGLLALLRRPRGNRAKCLQS